MEIGMMRRTKKQQADYDTYTFLDVSSKVPTKHTTVMQRQLPHRRLLCVNANDQRTSNINRARHTRHLRVQQDVSSISKIY